MNLFTTAFTEKGYALANRMMDIWEDGQVILRKEEPLSDWVEKAFGQRAPLLFIGATGIAVRAIAPYVQDKLTDSPVVVMDELGNYVIPILSGHVGGANDIAIKIARSIGAVPVITTATDINGVFAVDVFARRNQLRIMNREGIGKVSARLLSGQMVTMEVEGKSIEWLKEQIEQSRRTDMDRIVPVQRRERDEFVDIWISKTAPLEHTVSIWLKPKEYILGIGCRRGKSRGELELFLQHVCKEHGIEWEDIAGFASIDRKKDESGIVALAQMYGIPFWVYSRERLLQVKGNFTSSSFVESQVGVDNVCERAALLAAGNQGQIICPKIAQNGMTVAIAKKKWGIRFDET